MGVVVNIKLSSNCHLWPMSNVHIVHVHLQMTICGLCATQCVVRHRFAKERVGSHSVQANRLRPTMQCSIMQYTSLCKPTILCFAVHYKSEQTNLTMLYSAIQVCASQPYNALQCNIPVCASRQANCQHRDDTLANSGLLRRACFLLSK